MRHELHGWGFRQGHGQQPGQPGQVIAGVEDHHDARVAVVPVPGGDDPGHHAADLPGGDLGRVIGRAEPDRVQRQDPRRPAGLQRGDQRVRPAGDHLRVPFPARVTVAEQPLRAGGRIRAQPVAHVHRQPDPPVVPGRQPQRGQRPAQPGDLHLPAAQRLVHRAVPAAALRLQRQLRRHVHPVLLAQHCVAHLRQRVPVRPEAPEQLSAERGEHPARLFPALPVLDRYLRPGHTEGHGHRLHYRIPSDRTNSVAVAARCHGNTPDNMDKTRHDRQQRLNNKLRRRGAARKSLNGRQRPQPPARRFLVSRYVQ